MVTNEDIQIRDPFILPNQEDGKYYLFGSTDKDIWETGIGFNAYVGTDLKNWEGPFPIFRPPEDFYSEKNFWAPEVHEYKGKYYLFATFLRKDNERRGTAILISDDLLGPFKPYSDGPVTPREWMSLDGTLYVDDEGKPWMVFCHEWVEVGDGEICAMRLSEDLSEAAGEPITLFKASDAPWPTSFKHEKYASRKNYVTDGPFLFNNSQGELLMLWASFINNVYAQGVSTSATGQITGPWIHDEEAIYRDDGGHGMVFKTFDNQLMLSLHAPNDTPNERPVFVKLFEENGKIKSNR